MRQDISKNRSLDQDGPPSGLIRAEVPYDGCDYFTRQAVDDVDHRKPASVGAGGPKAVIGHLLFTDHEKTDLRTVMRRYNQAGIIPLEVPVTSGDDDSWLTDDRHNCVIEYEYKPDDIVLVPIQLEVTLDDLESFNRESDQIDALVQMAAEEKQSEVIEKLRQEASFSSELLLRMQVHLSLPIKKGHPEPKPVVKHMSIDWPEITSLRTTELLVPRGDGLTHVPVSYNPEKGRLEWKIDPAEWVRDSEVDKDDDKDGHKHSHKSEEVRTYTYSTGMVLIIGHPGELFKTPKLEVNAEVEVEGYLLSGLEVRQYGATGNRTGNQPKLLTKFRISAQFYPADEFARRTFSPHQQFIFDDIVPKEMRFTDVLTVLRNSKFRIDWRWPEEGSSSDSPISKWLVLASRSQGIDELVLLVAVEGERKMMNREQVLADKMVRLVDNRESGQLRISVLGKLRGDHKELTREINAFQQAVRERFLFHTMSRG